MAKRKLHGGKHKTGKLHHIGTLLLLAVALLALVTSITTPTVQDISLLKVTGPSSTVFLGTFGYSFSDGTSSSSSVGYDPLLPVSQAIPGYISSISHEQATDLARGLILHPLICLIAFISFFAALGSGFCGTLFAALLSAVTFLITILAVAFDFSLFTAIKNDVVNANGTAEYGTGIWTILVAMMLSFFATFAVLFSCCGSRRHKKKQGHQQHHEAGHHEEAIVTITTTTTKGAAHKKQRGFWRKIKKCICCR
ncbi:uncharacterized protein BP5553_07819 [Venustampulla echinocandica]|uniref:Pali-domain-containing protein n=1 Tax=Venustampulla echinocandica TaxID=2656787 RepID=A0A370THL5_9HELO|nr:uncharacterized protein BP5553_07819 [Venustampulla echinocandica]RDL34691.1 hypothetical protein BP5553_07819 [Venustampulla echinocandica]